MEAKTLDSQILKYLPLLGTEEKESLLGVIKSFLSLKSEKDLNNIPAIERYNLELDEALERINRGDYLTQREVEEQTGKW